jgi:hypothetical protein
MNKAVADVETWAETYLTEQATTMITSEEDLLVEECAET